MYDYNMQYISNSRNISPWNILLCQISECFNEIITSAKTLTLTRKPIEKASQLV